MIHSKQIVFCCNLFKGGLFPHIELLEPTPCSRTHPVPSVCFVVLNGLCDTLAFSQLQPSVKNIKNTHKRGHEPLQTCSSPDFKNDKHLVAYGLKWPRLTRENLLYHHPKSKWNMFFDMKKLYLSCLQSFIVLVSGRQILKLYNSEF